MRLYTDAQCVKLLEEILWNGTIQCPYCNGDHITLIRNSFRYRCNSCHTTFSATVNTLFHHTHIPLSKWFYALNLLLNINPALSARQLSEQVGINKNTAWSMMQRFNLSMVDPEQRNLILKLADITRSMEG